MSLSSHLREVLVIPCLHHLYFLNPDTHNSRTWLQGISARGTRTHTCTDTHPSSRKHLHTVKRRLGPGGQKLLLSGLVYTGSRCCWDCVMSAIAHRERSGGTLAQHIRGVNNLQSVTHATRSRLGKKAIYQCKSTDSQNLTSLFFRDADAEREEKVQM